MKRNGERELGGIEEGMKGEREKSNKELLG
jgi:hypothetical protein